VADLQFYSFDPAVEPDLVFSNFIFTSAEHLLLQSKKNWKVFGLKSEKKILLQLPLHLSRKKAISPLRAPFGSLQLAKGISKNQMDFFIKSVLTSLRGLQVESISIRNFPSVYHEQYSEWIAQCLLANGFTVSEQVSSAIVVNEIDFEKKIKPSERQKLKKSQSQFIFQQQPLSKLKSIYSFIALCRHERNQSLSMSFAQLSKTIRVLPDDFFLFEVRNSKELAAAAIVIRINREILYTFYYAHSRSFDKISPVVFLLSGIYNFAKENNYKLMDLGTSMIGSTINQPLLQFKKSIGGETSRKLVFERTLS
jgi:lipid II:glycine glycyltransferase (peptidoglycan interpeptide bridge formation enzyme)